MKKTILRTGLAVLLAAIISTAALAAEYVFVTKSGKKFHHVDSKFSQYEGAKKMTLEEAIELGYEPSKSYQKMKNSDDQAKAETK